MFFIVAETAGDKLSVSGRYKKSRGGGWAGFLFQLENFIINREKCRGNQQNNGRQTENRHLLWDPAGSLGGSGSRSRALFNISHSAE